MQDSYLDRLKKKREAEAAKKLREQTLKATTDAVSNGSATVAAEVARQSARSRQSTQTVKVANEDLAKKEDIDAVIRQLKEVQLAALMGGQPQKQSVILADSTDLGASVSELGDKIISVLEAVRSDKSSSEVVSKLAEQYKSFISEIQKATKSQSDAVTKAVSSVQKSIDSKEFSPKVKVEAPKVNVEAPDLSPIKSAIEELKGVIKANKVEVPKIDLSGLDASTKSVESAIRNLRFPVANYVLPFRDSDGKAVQQTISLPTERVFERASNTNGNSTALTNFGAVSGKKNYVRGYSITNTSASNGYVDFRDGTGGSVLWTVPIPANGGANLALEEPVFWTSANTALAFDVSAALTTVYISVTGYQAG